MPRASVSTAIRKSGGFAQHPQAVINVLQKCFDEMRAARLATFFLDLIETAKFQPRPACRFFARKARQLGFHRFALEKSAEPTEKITQHVAPS
jgi:hypothetical protein